MVIVLDEKLPPPPPYTQDRQSNLNLRVSNLQEQNQNSHPSSSVLSYGEQQRQRQLQEEQIRRQHAERQRQEAQRQRGPLPTATFTDLPPHIVLHIVYSCFPRRRHSLTSSSSTPLPAPPSLLANINTNNLVYHRQILYWIEMYLRLVNRRVYVACMNVLRSVYLPPYQALVRPVYSSDPFPLATASVASSSENGVSCVGDPPPFEEYAGAEGGPLGSTQRETAVLDLFIAAKVREDVWLDETELHLEREETFKDLFDLNQPRARIEDLLRHYGTRTGSISTLTSPTSPTSPISPSPTSPPFPFHLLSISFSPRQVGLQMSDKNGRNRKTIAIVERGRDERLEWVAKRLVRELDRIRGVGERDRDRSGSVGTSGHLLE